ncbi:hypothetical protein [Spiroplasma endosymbiont of Polydrusus formosus]|uniref:hypothetical protein n=1 Tax=Spiroplasma endosymbiont of Polydrusus formosus TaxID=3139326 RepID=UPI0035B536DE
MVMFMSTDYISGYQKIIINNENVGLPSNGIELNNKLYFGTVDGKIYKYFDFCNENINNFKKDLNEKNEINQFKTELLNYKNEFEKLPVKYVSLDQDQFLKNINKTIENIEKTQNSYETKINIDIRNN